MSSPPSYYPPGWDAERWQLATNEEAATLTEEDFERFHTGIRAHLGEEGAQAFFAEMFRRRAELKLDEGAGPVTLSDRPPNFIRTLQWARDDEGAFKDWGFVIFRTAGYGSDDVVATVKSKIEALIDQQFEDSAKELDTELHADIRRAKDKFQLMWVESSDLDGATPEEAARRYRLLEPPFNLQHTLFLCANEASLKSIQMPEGLAHVLAVESDCGDEQTGDEADDQRWTGTFKVAVDGLVTELFPLVGDSAMTPYEIGVGVTPDLVWTGIGRFGKKEASAQ